MKGHIYYPCGRTTVCPVQHHHVLKDLQRKSPFLHLFPLMMQKRTLGKILQALLSFVVPLVPRDANESVRLLVASNRNWLWLLQAIQE